MWDERYATEDYAYGTAPNDFVVECVELFEPGARVLDLGAGEGRNAVWLAERGCEVTAVDSSTVGLAKAERLAAARGVSIATRAADLAEFDLGTEAWDVVLAVFLHLPPPLRTALQPRIVRALRPGGLLVAEWYTTAQLQCGTGGPRDERLLIEPTTLRDGFEGLRFERFDERRRDVQEGAHHRGESAVLQCVARRGSAG